MNNVFKTKYLIDLKNNIDSNLNINDLFNNKNESLFLEIGFGSGEYLEQLSKNYKNTNFIGIETSLTSCYKTEVKLKKSNINNAIIILDDAKYLIKNIFIDNSFDKIIINFPCPWPKEKHKKYRLFSEDFIINLNRILKTNGIIELATDVEWYVNDTIETFNNNDNFIIDKFEKNFIREFMTKYEKKWDSLGRSKYLLLIKKIKKDININFEERGVWTMPHKFINKINENFENLIIEKEFVNETNKFKVKEVLNNKNKYLIRIISIDNNEYSQEYYLVLKKKELNKWILKLDTLTTPYRTSSVLYSIEKLSDIISN